VVLIVLARKVIAPKVLKLIKLASQLYRHRTDTLNSRATTPMTEESKEAHINKLQDDMPGEGTVHETREDRDVFPTCNRKVEENETAGACDGICCR
jgi:hypothetical protein